MPVVRLMTHQDTGSLPALPRLRRFPSSLRVLGQGSPSHPLSRTPYRQRSLAAKIKATPARLLTVRLTFWQLVRRLAFQLAGKQRQPPGMVMRAPRQPGPRQLQTHLTEHFPFPPRSHFAKCRKRHPIRQCRAPRFQSSRGLGKKRADTGRSPTDESVRAMSSTRCRSPNGPISRSQEKSPSTLRTTWSSASAAPMPTLERRLARSWFRN